MYLLTFGGVTLGLVEPQKMLVATNRFNFLYFSILCPSVKKTERKMDKDVIIKLLSLPRDCYLTTYFM